MAEHGGAVHVNKQGQTGNYLTSYLWGSWREGTKVHKETIANLSALPDHVIESIIAGLRGDQLVPADTQATIMRSLPHGMSLRLPLKQRCSGCPRCLARQARHGTW